MPALAQKTAKMELLEHRLHRPIEGYLRERYWRQGASFVALCADFRYLGVKVTPSTLTDWFRRLGIPTRRDPDREAV